MNNDKSKATWDVSTTEVFLKVCIDQIYNKFCQGSSFTRQGWHNIEKEFNKKTRRGYDRKQLKNRLDNLKKEWKAFDKLFAKETGIGWDSQRNTVVATDEWWERKTRENPAYEKFRYNGLRFRPELETIFKDTMASGEDMWAPSFTQPEPERDNEEDVYRPTMDLEEGLGGSEDGLLGVDTGHCTGVSDLQGINLTANTLDTARNIPSGSGSQGKRKRDAGLGRNKNEKIPSSKRITYAVSMIATASKDTADTVNKMYNSDIITELTADVISIDEIARDVELAVTCCDLLAYKTFRDTYAGMKRNRDMLVAWLKRNAQNSPPYAKTKKP